MRIFVAAVAALLLLIPSGCNPPSALSQDKWFTLAELETLEKFQGYDMCVGPEIEGPYRIVPGVNNTVKKETNSPLHRELDFDGKRWVFKHDDSIGYGFRFLAVGNPEGEFSAIMLKTEEKVSDEE